MTQMARFEMDDTSAKEDDEDMEKKAAGGGPLDKAMELLQALGEILAEALGGGEEESDSMDESEAPPVMASHNSPVDVKTDAAAIGKIAALEAQLAGFQAQSNQQRVESARDQAAYGFAKSGASNEDVDTFRMLWKQNGPDAARAFAESMGRSYASQPAPPPRGFNGDLPAGAGGSASGLLPAEVLAYQDKGPERFAEAKRWHAAWAAGSKRHPLQTYLAAQLDEGTFFTAGAGRI
ncbi:MAG TPA: hypothetical protein VMZ50_02465 [Phycisphaerae bacterium]|nr:hypothetical protein [Phycisphaerae bacterium]